MVFCERLESILGNPCITFALFWSYGMLHKNSKYIEKCCEKKLPLSQIYHVRNLIDTY